MPVISVDVLDHGFVKLIDSMGDDLRTVNAARISYAKHKDTFDEKDAELINYLAEHEHTAPFRHNMLTFHIKAPIFVFRQWMRYKVASDFNEVSGRYVDLSDVQIHLPSTFRRQAVVNKQGSEGEIDPDNIPKARELFRNSALAQIEDYKEALALGICREQARELLPLGMYSEVYWTASLQTVAWFIHQRTDSHAQWEIQQYAKAVENLTATKFNISLDALLKCFNHSNI